MNDSTHSRGTVPHLVAESPRTRSAGEGKGREGKGKGRTWSPIHDPHPPRETAAAGPVDNPSQVPGPLMDGDIDETLFPGYDPVPTEPAEKLSAGRRLTRRQALDIQAGRHPLALTYMLPVPLHPEADRTRTATSPQDGTPTCGTCRFRVLHGHHDQRYPKCTQAQAPVSNGPATDVRAWWPACIRFEPRSSA